MCVRAFRRLFGVGGCGRWSVVGVCWSFLVVLFRLYLVAAAVINGEQGVAAALSRGLGTVRPFGDFQRRPVYVRLADVFGCGGSIGAALLQFFFFGVA